MPENGQTQSNQSSVVTTPIVNPPKNTSPGNATIHEGIELEGQRGFPQPENLNEYYEFKKEPYALEYFNLSPEVRKVDKYSKYAQFLDDFVLSEIESNSLDGSLDSFRNIISQIELQLNLNPDTNSLVKLEKLYKWVKNILGPQRKIDRRKKELLGD